MRPFGARLSVLLATLVVVLASVAAHRSQYFCKMMGQAVAECCCASAREHVRPPEGVTARAPDCCERLGSSEPSVVATSVGPPANLTAAAFAVVTFTTQLPAPSYRVLQRLPAAARAPPALGPPLFVAHCSWLI